MIWSLVDEGRKVFLAKNGKKLPQHQLWDHAVVARAGAAFSPQMRTTALNNLRKKFEDLEDGPNEIESAALIAALKAKL